MKLNLANPQAGLQKTVEIDDEKKLLPFFEKRMGAEVAGDSLGEEFRGFVFRISGGNDKQGFPMLQGVLTNQRVRLLFKKGMKCYRPRRTGERKRKSVRGAIVGPDLAVLNLVLVKKGKEVIPGLTDGERPRRLGPKRASHIRKLFNLSKERGDDVRKFVVRRVVTAGAATGGAPSDAAGGKVKKVKAPRIQRLVTPQRLQRKRAAAAHQVARATAAREAAAAYRVLLSDYRHAQKKRRADLVAKKKKKVTAGEKEATAAPAAIAPGSAAAGKPAMRMRGAEAKAKKIVSSK